MIVVLSDREDDHVPPVFDRLRRQGADVIWIDPSQFPSQSSISLDLDERGFFRKTLCIQGRTVNLDDVTAVWLRRPNPVEAGPTVTDTQVREWIRQTASDTLNGAFELLDCLWVPASPRALRAASDKLGQLQAAAEIGFRVPRTCITNSPDAFLDLYSHTDGGMISKAVTGATLHDAKGEPIPTYTTVIRRRHALNARSVSLAPAIFQAYVPKRLELRITLVGDRLFPVAIDSQNSRATKHDWRHYDDDHTTYTPVELPADIAEKCAHLLRRYGLSFGAIDMVLTPDGEYVFLEINPNGQWAWVADLTELPIADAIADLLLSGTSARKTPHAVGV
jgi:glutathione synthase/RimK-type ligase-like ATP-grasp enzyme